MSNLMHFGYANFCHLTRRSTCSEGVEGWEQMVPIECRAECCLHTIQAEDNQLEVSMLLTYSSTQKNVL